MRNNYIEELVRFTGEDKREIWERKLGIAEQRTVSFSEEAGLCEKWKEQNGLKGRKIIFYYTSVSCMLKNDFGMIDKLRKVFDIFLENREKIAVIWQPDRMIERTVPAARPELWTEYLKVIAEYKESGIGIFDADGDIKNALLMSDAYYGDPGPEVERFRLAGKPVMIEDCSIL